MITLQTTNANKSSSSAGALERSDRTAGMARTACTLAGREYCYVIASSEGQSCRVSSLRPQWQDHLLSYDWVEKDAIGMLTASGWQQVQKMPLKADAIGDYSQSFFLIMFGREVPAKKAA